VAALLVIPFHSRDRFIRVHPGDHDTTVLRCAILLKDDPDHSLDAGLNYALVQRYAEDAALDPEVHFPKDSADYLDSLRKGVLDMVVAYDTDSLSEDGLIASRVVGDSAVWVVRRGNLARLQTMNDWIGRIQGSRYYRRVVDSYRYRHRVPGGISPYDSLIRSYAKEMDWDWRLLSSLIYHESRFSMDARSSRGAIGLMQVVPLHYSADSLMDPAVNLEAGTRYLTRLQDMFRPASADSLECIKFALAAYNAGEGRIKNCLKFAEERNVDGSRWDNLVELFPEMEDFDGRQTAAYVDAVLSTYYGYLLQY